MVGLYPQHKIHKVKIYKYKKNGLKKKQLSGDYISDIQFDKKMFTVLNHEWYYSKNRPCYFYCVPKVDADDEDENELLSLSFEAFLRLNSEIIFETLVSLGLSSGCC